MIILNLLADNMYIVLKVIILSIYFILLVIINYTEIIGVKFIFNSFICKIIFKMLNVLIFRFIIYSWYEINDKFCLKN
jgi:hypothetical protein